jgi:hypothetical protein
MKLTNTNALLEEINADAARALIELEGGGVRPSGECTGSVAESLVRRIVKLSNPSASAFDSGGDTQGVVRSPVEQFLDAVYSFEQMGAIDSGIDYIFQKMNNWLWEGNDSICNTILSEVDTERLTTDLLLSFLTITKAPSGTLPNRAVYREKIWKRIAALNGSPMATKLLGAKAQ